MADSMKPTCLFSDLRAFCAHAQRPSFFLACAVLFFGLAHIFLLPPFEGMDEIAHFSSLRFIAERGEIPLYGEAKIDAFVAGYREKGPLSYNVIKPFSANHGLTYDSFGENASLWPAYRAAYREPLSLPPFDEADTFNWQAQHPPLYYLLMAGALRLVNGASFYGQITCLRILSFLLAFAGLGVASLWLKRVVGEGASVFAWAVPFVSPMFFPEFGRLGNDSLCLLLLALCLFWLERWLRDIDKLMPAFLFALFLAAGLLTKAFFLPVAFGFSLFLAARFWPLRRDPSVVRALKDALSVIALPLAVAGFWYVYKAKSTGSLTGGADFITLSHKGGLLSLMAAFPFSSLLPGLNGFLETALGWTTGSIGLFSFREHAPILALNLGLVVAYALRLRGRSLGTWVWLPALLYLPVLAGFGVHFVSTIALFGNSQTPGWYMNIFLPLYALIFAMGGDVWERARTRIVFRALCGYALFFILANLAFEALLFAGYLPQVETKTYSWAVVLAKSPPVFEVLNRLSVLSCPKWSLVTAVFGLVSLFAAFVAWQKSTYGEKETKASCNAHVTS